MKSKILVVDDHENIRTLLNRALSNEYDVKLAKCGLEALEFAEEFLPDVILLDIMLPDISGHEVCGQLKSQGHLESIPIIMLTAKRGNISRTTGYSLGAINYVEKPFHLAELNSIIKSVLSFNRSRSDDLRLNELEIIVDSQVVKVNDTAVPLTTSEFKILYLMAQNVDRIFSRRELLERVSAKNLDITDRTIDNHISSLRKKFKNSSISIKTIYSQGYKLHVEARQ